MSLETGFTMDSSSVRYGPGMTRETGWLMKELGCRRVLLVTDRRLASGAAVATARESLRAAGLEAVVFDGVRVEPTDASFREAVEVASEGRFDGYVAVGGGSSMDTAKAADLYATWPADLLEYVNAPIGRAKPVPGPLKPLVAIPTTAGTGSETTGVAIFDYSPIHAKTGIAHRRLRPLAGIIDPDNTRTQPPLVAACCGLDVLSHALESYTALPYGQRPAPEHPGLRPAYQGSNPISDVWVERALAMVATSIVRAVGHPEDDEARAQMLLASTFAGIGFGNAGVHLPHGMSYPVSSNVRSFVPPGYPDDHPIVPHGMSVIMHTPAVVRFTAQSNPRRHLRAAELLGADVRGARPENAGEVLAGALIGLMRRTGMPNGLRELGYAESDVDALVAGTMPQHRVTKLCPRAFTEEDLRRLFLESLRCW